MGLFFKERPPHRYNEIWKPDQPRWIVVVPLCIVIGIAMGWLSTMMQPPVSQSEAKEQRRKDADWVVHPVSGIAGDTW